MCSDGENTLDSVFKILFTILYYDILKYFMVNVFKILWPNYILYLLHFINNILNTHTCQDVFKIHFKLQIQQNYLKYTAEYSTCV